MTHNNRLSDIFHPIEGSKTRLTQFQESDICDNYISWLRDPVVTQFSNQRFFTHSFESCLNYFRGFRDSPNLFLKIQRTSDMVFIGTMTTYFNPWHGTADVGILIGDRSSWGAGYGQDAWNTQLSWLSKASFIRKITAGTMRPNHAMVRLMERSGMKLEAIRFQQEMLDHSPQDLLYYCLFPNASHT
jgi:ribosomal-protein-alanine N-acetyltransferase